MGYLTLRPKTVAILVALVLIAIGVLEILSFGSILVITCTRNSLSEVNCDRQWTWWGYIPKSAKQPADIAELKRVCYVDGCNFWYDTPDLADTWAGFYGAEPVDGFLNGTTNHLSYDLGEHNIIYVNFVAIPVLSIACFILMFTIWQSARRKW